MSMREHIGVQLGFIALTGAISLVLVLALLGDRVKASSFEESLQELDWRAIFFYIALFALVGGLEKSHILDKLADALRPIFVENYALGATLLYWVTVPIVGLVEHDAYILTFLYTIKDMAAGRHRAVAAVLDAAVVRHARQQPDGRGRAGSVRRADPRREGGRAQGFAARVPGLEHSVHAGLLCRLLYPRHADLGTAVRA